MPRNYKRKSKRKPRRRRRKGYVPTGLAGTLGKTRLQRFKYCDKVELNPASLASDTYSFRLNSLFDPDFTGVGHQPIGFDQVMSFYNHYTVLGARMKATFISQAADTSGVAVVGIDITGSSTPTTAINDIYEQAHATTKIMTQSNSRGYAVVTKNLSVKKFLGQKNILSEDDNAGSASTNPAETIYGHLFATSVDAGSVVNPSYLDILVEIDFIAVLHEPKNLPGS